MLLVEHGETHINILKMFSSNHAKYYNSLRDSNKILIRIFDFLVLIEVECSLFTVHKCI